MRHHSLICSGSVVAFSCQPANSGRLSGPAGKTGRSAVAKSRAAVRFGSSERVAVSENVCMFTLFVSVEFFEAARIRRGPGIEPHHGIASFISPGSDGGGGGGDGAAAAGRKAEGRRMRMQSTGFPPIVVLVGYSSIRCPGQSSVSGQPVASQTASKFVAFNGSDLGTFSK